MILNPFADERALSLRHRVHRWRNEKLLSAAAARTIVERFATPWRSSGILAQIVGFGLAAAGLALFGAFCELLFDSTLFAGLIAIALAEWSILRLRWWSTGVESALWVGGLFALIFALPGEGKPEPLLLFMAASIAGVVRLRQPWFGALATCFLVIYLVSKDRHVEALAACVAIATVALALLHKRWSRPSTEWLLIALLLVAPPAGYLAAAYQMPQVVLASVFVILAVLFLITGLRLRHHAPLAATAIALIPIGIELRDVLPFPVEVRMTLAGAALLLLAALSSRLLRHRTTGLVLTPPARTDADELLDLGGAIIATPQQPAEAADGRPQGDGGFGGAGATGGF